MRAQSQASRLLPSAGGAVVSRRTLYWRLARNSPQDIPPRSGPLGRGSVFGAGAHGVRVALPVRPPTSSDRMVQGSNPVRPRVPVTNLPEIEIRVPVQVAC